jgi:hypothetical protein
MGRARCDEVCLQPPIGRPEVLTQIIRLDEADLLHSDFQLSVAPTLGLDISRCSSGGGSPPGRGGVRERRAPG